MKIIKSNHFYEYAHIIFYLRWYEPRKFIFNNMIFIRKQSKPLKVPINDTTPLRSFKIYKNMHLNFVNLDYNKFKEFYHEVVLTII